MNFDRFQLRSPTAKADRAESWARPDLLFFSSGACHILASVFLATYPAAGFRALMIHPARGFRGEHVVVASRDTIFEAAGYTRRTDFLDGYTSHFRARFAGWSAEVIDLGDDPADSRFCDAHGHRQSGQFLHDPRPRALAYLKTFTAPEV